MAHEPTGFAVADTVFRITMVVLFTFVAIVVLFIL